MNNTKIDEMKATIARFMDLNPIPCGTMRLGDIKHPNESMAFLDYDKDWNLLVPVIEKIETLSNDFVKKVWISINGCSCYIWTYYDLSEILRKKIGFIPNKFKVKIIGETKIAATFQAVFEFIEWFNTQNKTNGAITK